MKWRTLLAIGCCIAVMGCVGCAPVTEQPSDQTASPEPEAAFVKAAWVPYMEVETLLADGDAEAAIAACMQDIADRGCNTVYFHARAHSDAYYASTVFLPEERAASWLAKGIDPLAVAVKEAHARGLKIHAWVNPYRIGSDRSYAVCDDVFEYNDRWYYIPTSETAQTCIVEGVREIIERYDVDGVQFDDYFYPEGAVGATAASFEQPVGDDVAAWRREQVTALIRAVHALCRERDGCVFGVSPSYDIDRNRDQMYADVETWAKEGYVDYLCPQLYVGFQHQYAAFTEQVAVWTTLDKADTVQLIGGLALYKTGMEEDTYAGVGRGEWATGGDIIARQAAYIEGQGWDGVALYSHLSFAVSDDRDAAVVEAESAAVSEFLREI